MKSQFFINNRARLVESLDAEVVVLAGWTGMQWHGDSTVPFRQEANFWYVAGIEEAGWRLIIDGKKGKSWLVAPDTDEIRRLFDGGLTSSDALSISGVDEVIDRDEAVRLIKTLAERSKSVYTLASSQARDGFTPNPAGNRLKNDLKKQFKTVHDCRAVLERLRAIKQPEEIAAIEKAGLVTAKALRQTYERLSACRSEYEVEAEIGYRFRRAGAEHAFEPIVAAADHACTLHYVANSGILQPGQLVLIDTGARLGGYSADCTRTWVTGEPSSRQKTVHAAVKRVEQEIISLVRPGLSFKDYIEAVDALMKNALLDLGLMKNIDDAESYCRYFPHSISHGIGIDVHESLGGYKEFQSGMVLTVEPGIYIPEESIGVRIEDTIVVTDSGARTLTSGLSTDI